MTHIPLRDDGQIVAPCKPLISTAWNITFYILYVLLPEILLMWMENISSHEYHASSWKMPPCPTTGGREQDSDVFLISRANVTNWKYLFYFLVSSFLKVLLPWITFYFILLFLESQNWSFRGHFSGHYQSGCGQHISQTNYIPFCRRWWQKGSPLLEQGWEALLRARIDPDCVWPGRLQVSTGQWLLVLTWPWLSLELPTHLDNCRFFSTSFSCYIELQRLIDLSVSFKSWRHPIARAFARVSSTHFCIFLVCILLYSPSFHTGKWILELKPWLNRQKVKNCFLEKKLYCHPSKITCYCQLKTHLCAGQAPDCRFLCSAMPCH